MKAAKAWMALFMSLFIGGIGTGLSLGLVPSKWQALTLSLTTVLTGIGAATGVYKVPNAPADPPPPKHLPQYDRTV